MIDTVASLIVVLISALLMSKAMSRVAPRLRQLVRLSWLAHLASSIILFLIYRFFYGGGDMFNYFRSAENVLLVVDRDVVRYTPEIVLAFFQRVTPLDKAVFGAGSTTGSMSAMTSMLALLTGRSIVASGLILAHLSFTAKLAAFRGFCQIFPRYSHKRLAYCVLLWPSVVFWTSHIVKETVAMIGVGWAIFHMINFTYRRRPGSLVGIALCLLPVAMIKPYVIFPFSVGAGVFYVWTQRARRAQSMDLLSRPQYLLLALVVGVGAIFAMGQLFPQYAPENLNERINKQIYYSQTIKGGSTYILDENVTSPEDQAQPLTYLPVGLVSALFRPFLFEVRNALMLLNALETTLLLWLVFKIFQSGRVRAYWRLLTQHPGLLFCLIFALVFGVAVGLSTTNLGTLSRYRVPMMPFYAMILVLPAPRRRAQQRHQTLARRDTVARRYAARSTS